MNWRLIKKDLELVLSSRVALFSVIFVIVLETALISYVHNIISNANDSGVSIQFNYMQSFILIFYFPVIITNILILAFSVTKEKNCFMLAKLLPFGESTFLRSKVTSAVLIAVFISFPSLFAGIYFCGLDIFLDLNFLISTSFYLLFTAAGLASFSISFAVNYYQCRNNYEPDLKGIIGFMFFVSLTVIASFLIYIKKLRFFYEYVMGFSHDYPNREFVELLIIGFLFLILSRLMLNMTERKLLKE